MKNISKDVKITVDCGKNPEVRIDMRKVSFLRRLLLCVGFNLFILTDGCLRIAGTDFEVIR